jgi:hypothetical protein
MYPLLLQEERHGRFGRGRWQHGEGGVIAERALASGHRGDTTVAAEEVLADEVEGEVIYLAGELHAAYLPFAFRYGLMAVEPRKGGWLDKDHSMPVAEVSVYPCLVDLLEFFYSLLSAKQWWWRTYIYSKQQPAENKNKRRRECL